MIYFTVPPLLELFPLPDHRVNCYLFAYKFVFYRFGKQVVDLKLKLLILLNGKFFYFHINPF